MIEIISKNGKKIMSLSDDGASNDKVFIDGEQVSLDDAYSNKEVKEKFNNQIKELKDDK